VKISVLDAIAEVRPGLTCSAKIKTADRPGSLALPIQALTLRKPDGTEAKTTAGAASDGDLVQAASPRHDREAGGTAAADPHVPENGNPAGGPIKKKDEKGKVEGVFVVREGVATFQPVTVGITGEKDFEILSGLSKGDVIVTGPFKALRTLKTGDHVKAAAKREKKPGEPEEEGDESEAAKDGAAGA